MNVHLSAVGTSSTLKLTGVKLEQGGVATRFEHEPYDDVLRKCQRYYEASSTIADMEAGNGYHTFKLLVNRAAGTTSDDCLGPTYKVTKRTRPKMRIWDRTGIEGWVSAFNNNIQLASVKNYSDLTSPIHGINTVSFDQTFISTDVAYS